MRLSEIYTNAYGPDAPEPRVISIWGIQIDVADSASDPRASVVLMKFLRATRYVCLTFIRINFMPERLNHRWLNVDEAQVQLTNTLKWRRMFKMITTDKILTPRYKSSSFAHFGHDKMGLPVMFVMTPTSYQPALTSICARYIKVSEIHWERFQVDKIGALACVLLNTEHLYYLVTADYALD